MFGGDGLWDFIHKHQDCLEHLEGLFHDLMMMVENVVERLNSKLLVWMMALEGTQDSLIIIPDSLPPIPILAPGGNLLVEIEDGTDNTAVQVIVEDQAEGKVRRRVTIEEGGVFGVVGELYEEGEDIMDILRRVEVWDAEIPHYPEVPSYDNPNYIPDRQV